MERIGALDSWRLHRELGRREAALREAANAPQPAGPKEESLVERQVAEATQITEPKPELVTQHASMTWGWWKCHFCEREYASYGLFLNHNCHEDD